MLLWIVCGSVAIILIAYAFIQWSVGNKGYWTKQHIHEVHQADLFTAKERWLFEVPFADQDLRLYQEIKKKPGTKMAGTILFRHPMLYIMDLDIVKNILVKDFDHFVNRQGIGISDPYFEKMLVNMTNQEWKDLRATMTPTFTTSKMRRMFEVFSDSSKKMTNYLKQEISSKGHEVEMRSVSGKFTMDVIASSAFGVNSQTFEKENSLFATNGKRMQDSFGKALMFKFFVMILLPKLANTLKLSFFDKRAAIFLDGVIRESIRRRRELGEKRNDFLQLMLEAQQESTASVESKKENERLNEQDKDSIVNDSGKRSERMNLSDDVIVAQCLLFFVGGFDNIESLLMWSFYELACNPECQEKLYNELKNAVKDSKNGLTYEVVNSLEYLDMVISETLRKYPFGVRIDRICNKDYKIDGTNFVIKKDMHVAISVIGLHHDEDIFPNPGKYDPERFTAEAKSKRHPYAYQAFGIGPRSCIANRFAILEGKAAVANMIYNFKLSPGKKTDIPPIMSKQGILKPQNGIWLNLQERNN